MAAATSALPGQAPTMAPQPDKDCHPAIPEKPKKALTSTEDGIIISLYGDMAIDRTKDMKNFIRVMKALSDPNRVRILKLLEDGELCVCEIQQVLGLAQSTVSKHMKLLEDAGLTTKKRQGTWMLYRLAAPAETIFAQTMLRQLRGWLDDDPRLQVMRQVLPDAARLRDRAQDDRNAGNEYLSRKTDFRCTPEDAKNES